jgi:hypothetical protein
MSEVESGGTYSDFDDHSILCKFLLIFPFLDLSLFYLLFLCGCRIAVMTDD